MACPRYYWSAFLLVVLAIIPYLPTLKGEFLYDDVTMVEHNPDLLSIKSLRDVLSYQPQPTRPVANFFIAAAHLLGKGNVIVHRLFSVACHALVTAFIYLNLIMLSRTIASPGLASLCFPIAILFALSPVLSEAILVSQFRSEILATLFTLLALLITQLLVVRGRTTLKKLILYGMLFVCIGLAQLSKETYAVICIISILIIYHELSRSKNGEKGRVGFWKFFWFICKVEIFWGFVLAFRAASEFRPYVRYADFVGMRALNILGVDGYVRLVARALIEAHWKIFAGHGLTMQRMAERYGPFSQIDLLSCLLILTGYAALTLALFKCGRWIRIWAGLSLVSFATYWLIPNVNAGSEHYLYFPTIAVLSLFCSVLAKIFKVISPTPARTMWFATICYGIYFSLVLETRLLDLRSNWVWHLTELEEHPESPVHLIAMIGKLGLRQGRWDMALPYLEEAKRKFPKDPYLPVVELAYYLKTKQIGLAQKSLEEIEKLDLPKETLADIHLDIGVSQADNHLCGEASKEFAVALSLQSKEVSTETLSRYREVASRHLRQCTHVANLREPWRER